MGTRAAINEETYLRTSFDGPDREFADGEVGERDLGGERHSAAQTSLGGLFFPLRTRGLIVRLVLCIRLKSGVYRAPGVAVFWPDKPNGDAPSNPP